MPWVDVKERLPPEGVPVVVFGDYTPETVPLPTATITDPERRRLFGSPWSSVEWRGMVAIRFWWEQDPLQ